MATVPAGLGLPRRVLRRLRRVASVVRDGLFLVADAIAAASVVRRQPSTDSGGRVRLAIIFVHGIGDLVIWRDALERLRDLYPPDRVEVTIVCMDGALAFARAHVPADHHLPIQRQRFRTSLGYRVGIVREVARRNFSVVVQPTFNRYLLVEDAITRASRAPRRIGSSGTGTFLRPYERRISDRWYSRIVPAAPAAMHDLARAAEFLRGLALPTPALRLARIPPPAAPAAGTRGYVAICVSSSSHLKTWPLRRFEEVAHLIVAETGRRVVFCGDAAEAGLRNRFDRWDEAMFVDRAGTTDLPDFLGLLDGADLVLSSDTGTVHIALALRRPSVVVLGGGLVARYHPYPPTALADGEDRSVLPVAVSEPMPCFDCGWHCRFGPGRADPAPCVTGVTVGAVAAEVFRKLDRIREPTVTGSRAGSG